MTCREKLKLEDPIKVSHVYVGGAYGCPHSYNYAEKPEHCTLGVRDCTKCWDREVEEKEE